MVDLDRFKRARQKQEFIQNTNSDIETKEVRTVVTRNKSSIQLEENTLSPRQRSRTKQGRNITIPLFHEELSIIEEAVSKLSENGDTSINNFIRESILKECKRIIKKDAYESIISNKFNVIKNK